ncbi:conserved exported hypothetical protein [Mesorhizobium metallidurans STM 2683]|uniref:Uncharacterized protein n=1 Tax=Mesorhizobium metallidurans STM 2683 TaxID=1297569 RepID=M5EZQ9_9HYPH|nr:hypothetical protein [Mesorhizobium metallidurans]CCV09563.1 conserved exported hypothetical protein [Mesorhizobium metallidurans STM 2683]
MTILKFLLGGAVAIAGAAALPSQSKASEWGCQVLLCLSGDWQGTPSCHPPIYKLIAAMEAPGFDWPTCPQANSSAAKFEKYADCPPGWQAVGGNDSDRPGMGQGRNMCRIASDRLTLPVTFMNSRLGQNREGSRQAQIEFNGKLVTAEIQSTGNDRGRSAGNGPTYFTISRPMREKPWFIEYDDANGIRQKSWFNLNMP